MSFKENLLKKIELDQRRVDVLASLGASSGVVKVDKGSMRFLLENAGQRHIRLRTIDMYLPDGADDSDTCHILVLDNELAVYHTTISDVLVRKDPTLKEMISIRNAIKILNDSDVIISKKEASVETIYQKSIEAIDLSFSADDIKQLEYDGRSAVEWKDDALIKETLSLFNELLDFKNVPKALWVEHATISAVNSVNEKNEDVYGPLILYSIATDTLKYISEKINPKDKDRVEFFHTVAKGLTDATMEGPSVIKHLAEEVVLKHNK